METLCVECGESVSELEDSCSNCGTKKDIFNGETVLSDSEATLDSEAIDQVETLGTPTKPLENSKLYVTENSLIGKSIGGAVVKKQIGKGGMGSVFLGHHSTLDIPVAIKVLKPDYAQRSPDAVERFLKEARAVAKLRHPNIVSVYNAGHEEGFYFMSMEFIKGRDLAEILESPFNLSLKDALKLTCQVCDALEYAHKNSIVHRDIKPANIFVDEEGNAKVGDLGLAKDLKDDQSMTQSMQAMGTPYYISPEQATSAKDVDHRSDIYSLGCTLYRLFCGKVPFKGNSSFETVHKHISEPVPDPKKENPELPLEVAQVIQKMMAKKPEERFEDLNEVTKILKTLLDNISDSRIGFAPKKPIEAKEETPKEEKPALPKSKKTLITAISFVILVLIIIIQSLPDPSTGLTNGGENLYRQAKNYLDSGNYLKSKTLFSDFFSNNPHLVDAHLDYSVLLKQMEGIEGAREEYRLWSEKSKNPSVSLAYLLLLNKEKKATAKEAFEQNYPDFGPYYYYTSLDWIKDPVGQTFAEKREELRLLQKFKEVDSQGKFLKYFADRALVDSTREDADRRLKKLTQIQKDLENPVELQVGFGAAPQNPSVIIGESSRNRRIINIQLNMKDYINVKEIFYKYPGMKEFASTGLSLDPRSSPKLNFSISSPESKMIIEIKYLDRKGLINGPYKLEFDPLKKEVEASKRFVASVRENLVMYRDYDNRLLFYFTTLLTYSKGMKEIRYSVDKNSLDINLKFDPLNPYEMPYVELPNSTKTVFIQITYKDDSKSEILEFPKPADLRKE
ncbi:MAG: serine/threonine protein kinase [Lentisphaeraceae bacterium]|nr:serine/threonine protein kinase [Lentisphaeraceae bacterium]